jgi:hypothetical protein
MGRMRRIMGNKTLGPGSKFYGTFGNRMGHNPNEKRDAC